jgi:hypothetical protein
LDGFDGVNGAAIRLQKGALAAGRLAKAELVTGAVDETAFEVRLGESEKSRDGSGVGGGEINVSGAVATADTTGLAGEADAVHGFPEYPEGDSLN